MQSPVLEDDALFRYHKLISGDIQRVAGDAANGDFVWLERKRPKSRGCRRYSAAPGWSVYRTESNLGYTAKRHSTDIFWKGCSVSPFFRKVKYCPTMSRLTEGGVDGAEGSRYTVLRYRLFFDKSLMPNKLQRIIDHSELRKNIILIGYRGTGKSTLARRLGERLGVASWDSDPEIERRAGKTIAEIFSSDGEAAFRDLEATVIADLLRNERFVLATGGGAILREETRELLRRHGLVVWLTASPETILNRMVQDKNSLTTRPSLTSLPPLEEILAVLEKRRGFYEQTAHVNIETDAKCVDDVVAEIIDCQLFQTNVSQ